MISEDRDILRFLVRIATFGLVLAMSYGAVVRVVAPLMPRGVRVLTTMPPEVPVGQTLLMAEEASTVGPVDILFIGSSHVYQTFDPRLFDKYGIRIFNLASTAQAPLQSYYLQRQFLEELDPTLVVVEIWMALLPNTGSESAIDLIANLPISTNLIRMTFATHDIRAYNAFVRRVVEGEAGDPSRREPGLIGNLQYVERGFAEPTGPQAYQAPWEPPTFHINERNLRYLERIAADVRSTGAEIIFVMVPIPPESLDMISDRRGIDERLRRFADGIGVPYIDFNDVVTLDTERNFAGWHHLSREGVRVFTPLFIDELERRGFLRGIRAPRRPRRPVKASTP